MEPVTTLRPGDRLGDFRIIRQLGRGGMGVVYLVRDEVLGRQVALKVIAPDLAHDGEFQERFEAEARSAAAIEHPNAVPVYSAGSADGNLFIAMRYIAGTDLRQALSSSGPLDPRDAAQLIAEVAAALDAAHAVGLVHRDVKPANILLAGEPGKASAYLTDFGLTRGLGSSQVQLTRTGQWIGTLDYVAPEQMAAGRVDARTDIYSLGSVLYEMLTGSVPFTGDEMQKLWSKANEEPPPLAADGSPDPFDPVIARAVARDPERRFRSAGDLARAASMAAGADAEAPTERSVATGVAATGMLEVDPPAERVPRVRHPSLREQPTNQLPRPPAPATGRKRGAEGSGRTVALLVGSLALAIGLVVAAVVVAGDKDGANRTVITRAAETTASEEAPSTSSEGEGASARAETAPAPVEFNGSYFSTTLPVGWRQVENESWASDGSYVENTWISPDGGEEIKIDMSVGEPADPAVSLATIGGAVEESGQTVYATTNGVEHGGIVGSELDFSADSGIPERADFFFNFDGNGFAVMGSSYDLETSQALIGPVVAALSTSH